MAGKIRATVQYRYIRATALWALLTWRTRWELQHLHPSVFDSVEGIDNIHVDMGKSFLEPVGLIDSARQVDLHKFAVSPVGFASQSRVSLGRALSDTFGIGSLAHADASKTRKSSIQVLDSRVVVPSKGLVEFPRLQDSRYFTLVSEKTDVTTMSDRYQAALDKKLTTDSYSYTSSIVGAHVSKPFSDALVYKSLQYMDTSPHKKDILWIEDATQAVVSRSLVETLVLQDWSGRGVFRNQDDWVLFADRFVATPEKGLLAQIIYVDSNLFGLDASRKDAIRLQDRHGVELEKAPLHDTVGFASFSQIFLQNYVQFDYFEGDFVGTEILT